MQCHKISSQVEKVISSIREEKNMRSYRNVNLMYVEINDQFADIVCDLLSEKVDESQDRVAVELRNMLDEEIDITEINNKTYVRVILLDEIENLESAFNAVANMLQFIFGERVFSRCVYLID